MFAPYSRVASNPGQAGIRHGFLSMTIPLFRRFCPWRLMHASLVTVVENNPLPKRFPAKHQPVLKTSAQLSSDLYRPTRDVGISTRTDWL